MQTEFWCRNLLENVNFEDLEGDECTVLD